MSRSSRIGKSYRLAVLCMTFLLAGCSDDKPVGTVWFAWSLGDRPADSERRVFAGDREAVRRQTVACALQGLIDRLVP